jgi:hypothetical protein
MSGRRPKLDNRQIWLLLLIEKQCGLTGRTRLSQKQRELVVSLWRRELVEIWWRKVPDDRPIGPYFSLTASGYQLACSILASRDERRRKRVCECVDEKPRALAA